MEKIILGKTGIHASRIAFGALPLQRTEKSEAIRILHKAFDSGVNFYDTARMYTDSEEKLGAALSHVRSDIFIASKVTGAQNGDDVQKLLESSLKQLQTDHIDIMQFHNPSFVPRPGGQDGMYDALVKARQQGKIGFIGFTNHNFDLVARAIGSGLYDTVQYPMSYLSLSKETDLLQTCEDKGIGFLAMKPLGGGLLNQASAVFHFFDQHKRNCLPLYGIQRMEELEEFLGFLDSPPDAVQAQAVIGKDRQELMDEFCRGCGYCLPCAANIDLPIVTRMCHLLRRAPLEVYMTDEWHEKMLQTRDCTGCGQCNPRCPYGLDPQHRLPAQLEDYLAVRERFLSEKI